MQRVRLHQNTRQIDALQQRPQGRCFAALVSGVGGLGDRHTQLLGIKAHLGNVDAVGRRP